MPALPQTPPPAPVPTKKPKPRPIITDYASL